MKGWHDILLGTMKKISSKKKAPEITIYSMPECPPCIALKAFLKEHGIEYKDFDVEFNMDNRAKLVELSGGKKVPFVLIGEEKMLGFDEAKVRSILQLA